MNVKNDWLQIVSSRNCNTRVAPTEEGGGVALNLLSAKQHWHLFFFLFSVMDGEDLSKYDSDLNSERLKQNSEDKEELEKLEWELASESGRLTGQFKAHFDLL